MEMLLEHVGKRVTVTHRDEGENKVITGLVEKANAACILVRPKGRPFVLIDAEDIASIVVVEEPSNTPRIKVRSMEKILPEHVRQHLADRHGVPLHEIPDGDAEAVKMHDLIGHRELGHQHRPDAAEVAQRAAALEREMNGPDCQHQGVECDDAECPCRCVDCMYESVEED